MNNQNMTDVSESIRNAAVGSEDYLAVHIADSYGNQVVSGDTIRTKKSVVYFFQVSDSAEIVRKPLTLRDENGNKRGPVSSGSGIDYTQLFDNNGDDVLRNDSEEWRLYHVSVGVLQDEGRLYPRIPDNQNGGGWTYLSGSQPDPTEGEGFGFLDAEALDFNNPPVEASTIVWKQGTRSHIQYGFYNNSNLQIDPIISVVGQGYEARPVADRDSKLRLLAEITRQPSQRDVEIRTVNYNRTGLRSFSYDTPDEWKDAQNSLEISEANLPTEIINALQKDGGGS